jgi:molybdopterin converting factor small subunit
MSDRSITLRLHAALRDAANARTIEVTIADNATPRDAFRAAIGRCPALGAWRDVVAFGTDERLLAAERPIPAEVVEIHALPPVSGG